MSVNSYITIFTYYLDIMIFTGGGIILLALVAYFWKKRSKKTIDTHEGDTTFQRTYNPSYKTSIIKKAVDGDKKHWTRGMAIGLFFICLFLAGCSSIESQVQSQIQQSEKTIIEKQQVIDEATAEKTKQEKIKQAGIAYLEALQGNTPKTHTTAAIPQKANDTKPLSRTITLGYGKCVNNDGIETVGEKKYEDYTMDDNCGEFAGTNICYKNKKEKCIIFDDEDKYNKWMNE